MLSDNTIISSINDELRLSITNLNEAINELEKERYARFNELIDEKFSDAKLIELLENFENRADDKIKEYITYNAEVYTLFEYVLGIVWYKINERQGKILDYMQLSLYANYCQNLTQAVAGLILSMSIKKQSTIQSIPCYLKPRSLTKQVKDKWS